MLRQYYTDLLPKEIQYELFMYIPLWDIMPNLELYGNVNLDYTMNEFYARYIDRIFWRNRIAQWTDLPKDFFIDFINDNDMNNVYSFIADVESRPFDLYNIALGAGYVNLLKHLPIKIPRP